MTSASAIVVPLLLLLLAAVGVYYYSRLYGWAYVRSVPGRAARLALNAVLDTASDIAARFLSREGYTALFGNRRRRAAASSLSLATMRFLKYSDPVHKFSFVYPASWSLLRTENPDASIIVQVMCDSADESYKRFSVAWDDVSWSATTAESFGRNVALQLPHLVPGSTLLTSGAYDAAIRVDGAYQLVYRIADAMDGSELQLLNVVVVAQHGAARRAYTITFGTDADVYDDVFWLARHMVDSFHFDDPGAAVAVGGGAAATRRRLGSSRASVVSADYGGSGGHMRSPSATSADMAVSGADEVHVPVWERGSGTDGGSSKGAHGSGSISSNVSGGHESGLLVGLGVNDTPPDPSAITWDVGVLAPAGLSFQYPSTWVSSGVTSDDAVGFAELALHSVRRWCASYTCDRRESAYKHMSIVAVDLSSCADLIASARGGGGGVSNGGSGGGGLSGRNSAAANAAAGSLSLQAASTSSSSSSASVTSSQESVHALLLQYLVWRYRREVAENATGRSGGGGSGSNPSGSSYNHTPLSTPTVQSGDEALAPWLDMFASRWPQSCRLATPALSGAVSSVVSGSGGGGGGNSVFSSSTAGGTTGSLRALGGGGLGSSSGSGGGNSSSNASSAAIVLPHWTHILDQRVVSSSRLLKVGGWIRTAPGSASSASSSSAPSRPTGPTLDRDRSSPGPAAPASPSSAGGGGGRGSAAGAVGTPARGGGGSAPFTPPPSSSGNGGMYGRSGGALSLPDSSPTPARHYSTYSTMSMSSLENESVVAEGLFVGTTSAVLIGVYEAPTTVTRGGRRTFGHVVTFATTADAFSRFEGVAKHVFGGLTVSSA